MLAHLPRAAHLPATPCDRAPSSEQLALCDRLCGPSESGKSLRPHQHDLTSCSTAQHEWSDTGDEDRESQGDILRLRRADLRLDYLPVLRSEGGSQS